MAPIVCTQAHVDALFAGARSARVTHPIEGFELLRFDADELPALREALRVVDAPPSHCLCLGDWRIELFGRWWSCGALSVHHGLAIRLEGGYWDARLADGAAFFRLLAARGHPGPLAAFEAAAVTHERGVDAHGRWVAAAPDALRPWIPRLATGIGGSPPLDRDPAFDAALAAARGADDVALARALLAWFGGPRSPFSGYPGYEHVAEVLLRRLPDEALRAAVLAADTPDEVDGAARLVACHEVVSFRRRLVRSIPVARIDALAAAATAARPGDADTAARLAYARELAAYDPRAEAVAQAGREVGVALRGVDGGLSGLVTDGHRLAALDVGAWVWLEPDDGTVAVAAPGPYLALAAVDGGWVGIRGDTVDRAGADGVPAPWVTVARPVAAIGAGSVVALSASPLRDRLLLGPVSAPRLVFADRDRALRDGPEVGGVAHLAADARHVYVAETDLDRRGRILAVPVDGGRAREVARGEALGHAMAEPAMVVDAGGLVYADGRRLLRAGGQAIVEAPRPIGAFVRVGDGWVLLLGTGDEGSWAVARVDGGAVRILAEVSRRPYERGQLVAARGCAWFTLGDALYRVGWPRGPAT